MNKHQIIALSAASGCGKTTILKRLDGTVIGTRQVRVMTSVTTRPLREPNEAFRRAITEDEFHMLRTQMPQCIRFDGHEYGILACDIDRALADENIVFADVVAEGVAQLEDHYPGRVQAIFLYLSPQALLKRLKDRNSSPAQIRQRMHLSGQQLQDALGLGRYIFIKNDELEQTLHDISGILMGHPVKTTVPDLDRYLTELKEVMSNAQF